MVAKSTRSLSALGYRSTFITLETSLPNPLNPLKGGVGLVPINQIFAKPRCKEIRRFQHCRNSIMNLVMVSHSARYLLDKSDSSGKKEQKGNSD